MDYESDVFTEEKRLSPNWDTIIDIYMAATKAVCWLLWHYK